MNSKARSYCRYSPTRVQERPQNGLLPDSRRNPHTILNCNSGRMMEDRLQSHSTLPRVCPDAASYWVWSLPAGGWGSYVVLTMHCARRMTNSNAPSSNCCNLKKWLRWDGWWPVWHTNSITRSASCWAMYMSCFVTRRVSNSIWMLYTLVSARMLWQSCAKNCA